MPEHRFGDLAPEAPRQRWLVFGYGNPSRGDDALGPLFVERAQSAYAGDRAAVTLEFLTDFQLQVEHALDLIGFDRVVFVDASVACEAPFEHAAVSAAPDRTLSSHMLSPQALLHVYPGVSDEPVPPTFLLAIRGHSFELGQALSVEAARNLDRALEFFGALAAACGQGPLLPQEHSGSEDTRRRDAAQHMSKS